MRENPEAEDPFPKDEEEVEEERFFATRVARLDTCHMSVLKKERHANGTLLLLQ